MPTRSLPNEIPLPELERHLARRYPGLQVTAEIFDLPYRDHGPTQRIRFDGPVAELERHGLTTRAFLERAHDGRHRRMLDGCGSTLAGSAYGNHDDGYFLIFTRIDPDDEPLPKWAEKAGERIVRRLQKART